MNIVVVTSFPNNSWEVYSKAMLMSFVKYWPQDIPLLVNLDDDLLFEDAKKILRPNDGLCCGWDKEHIDFVDRNKGKDDLQDYRKQAVRFCHKVFALKHTLTAIEDAKNDNAGPIPRYLVWLDADVITNSNVSRETLQKCFPSEGDAVSYLGRKDWDHSECGWLAFDLENGGDKLIKEITGHYEDDGVFNYDQWHDSWVFDRVAEKYKKTNLTQDKPGMDIWQHSPMAAFSIHHKGPVAKETMKGLKTQKNVPLRIETKNSLPNETIKNHITENQKLIKNWLTSCVEHEEEVVVVSAGPMLALEQVLEEYKKGKKIAAVKHAIKPLKELGITPWACILLDPRPHVNKFVENPDKNVLWFVASQVDPTATKTLLDAGCKVFGYHAAVGANEQDLTKLQPDSIISGGSATATRGLFVLNKLGFKRFVLYGYDLCFPTKPDMSEKDNLGQIKHYEVTISSNHPYNQIARSFWSTAEFIAQYQEMSDICEKKHWEIKAVGSGIIPFMFEAKSLGNLREAKEKGKVVAQSYKELVGCKKKTLLATLLKR